MVDMRDRQEYKVYVPGNKYVYRCVVCKMVIASTEVPMEEEGLRSKMRQHRCAAPGKADFEMEII